MCHKIQTANSKIRTKITIARIQPRRRAKCQDNAIRPLQRAGSVVVGSMDVKGLYPAIQWIKGPEEMGKGVEDSKVKFPTVNK